MWVLQIDTYEGRDPVPTVTHVFYGDTRADAKAVADAHRETDEFFAGSFTGEWNGIELHNRSSWRHV